MSNATATLSAATASLSIRKLTGSIGAEIEGLDLARPLDDAAFAALHAAVTEHQVVFLRDQHLTDDQHEALAMRFGTPSIYPAERIMGGTKALHHIADSAASPPKADHWHTDISWLPEPPSHAFLSAVQIPQFGGDTMWASLFAAYDALSEPIARDVQQAQRNACPASRSTRSIPPVRQIWPRHRRKVRCDFPAGRTSAGAHASRLGASGAVSFGVHDPDRRTDPGGERRAASAISTRCSTIPTCKSDGHGAKAISRSGTRRAPTTGP